MKRKYNVYFMNFLLPRIKKGDITAVKVLEQL